MIELSKYLCLLLRHQLEKTKLDMDWDNDNFDEPLYKMTYDIFHSTK